jgi:Fe-Mn family superoxide dismutase
MAFELPKLPYELDALAPNISKETLEYHYGKHHAAYVNNLNKLIEGTAFAGQSLEDIVKKSDGGLFNNAAQALNHMLYWNIMSPSGSGKPSGDLAAAIDRDFGSFDAFKTKYTQAANTHFGSGWAWLAKNQGGKLEVLTTVNAGNPIRDGYQPILNCDVWEHSYYIDYRNARPTYVEKYFELINWDYVAKQFVG